jgi:hypothetical protein
MVHNTGVALGLLVTAVVLLSACWARPSEEKNLTDSEANHVELLPTAVRDCSLARASIRWLMRRPRAWQRRQASPPVPSCARIASRPAT